MKSSTMSNHCNDRLSNAIKFTHEGKVGIKLHVLPEPYPENAEEKHLPRAAENSAIQSRKTEENLLESQRCGCREDSRCHKCQEYFESCNSLVEKASLADEDTEKVRQPHEKMVWLCCDVYDTGIGIPGCLHARNGWIASHKINSSLRGTWLLGFFCG